MAATFCRRSFLNYKNCLFQTQKRTGFVVLIPETPQEAADCELDCSENLPDFRNINLKTCHTLINKFAKQYELGMYELNEYFEKNKTEKVDIFKQLFEPMEVLSVPFEMSFGVATTLFFSNAKNISSKTFFSLSDRVMSIKTYKYSLGSVYSICKKTLEEENKLTEEQKRILKKFVWEGTLNGLNLDVSVKQRLWKSFTAIALNKKDYELRYTSAKNFFQEIVHDKNFAKNCPLDLLRYTAIKWDKPFVGPWVITLKKNVYDRFMEFCDSRESRFHVWLAYNQLCSKLGESTCNATESVEKLRDHKHFYAHFLGYPSYCHLSMKNKMAESVENVQNVLSDLLEPAKYAQEKEIYDLEKFAYLQGSRVSLEVWDYKYWKRLYLKDTRNLDELALCEYFPFGQVLLGLVALCEQLFGIEIEEQTSFSAWNGDVRYFRILDVKTKAFLGGFYLDPYGHKNKYIGETNEGWFIPMRPKSKFCNSFPLSTLMFSFEPPNEDKPSLLYFRDVKNLFQQFGTMLQFTLSEMNYSEVSGLTNTEWDAIDITKNFLRFWLYDKHTLESISGHYKSGEPLPSKVLENLSQIDTFMAGTDLCRLIYYSNLDLEMNIKVKESCLTIAERLWPQHFLFKLAPMDYHFYGVSDLIIGPWSSSYYSTVWSKMLAADVFSAFQEAGLKNQEEISVLGKRFRSTFLALGGGCDAKEIFKRFRERDPNPKLLLKVLNIKDYVPPPILAPESEELVTASK